MYLIIIKVYLTKEEIIIQLQIIKNISIYLSKIFSLAHSKNTDMSIMSLELKFFNNAVAY